MIEVLKKELETRKISNEAYGYSSLKQGEYQNNLMDALQHFIGVGERMYDEHPDWQEHDKMSTSCLAEHLGLPLYLVMEIARWANVKLRPGENNV
jgi:hypothetical protein